MEINPLNGTHSVTQDVVSKEHASHPEAIVKAPETVKELAPQLSKDSELMSEASEQLGAIADVDMALVKSIRQQLESGEMPIDFSELAGAISDFHFRGDND